MAFIKSSLTVYFENPFWVGVYEKVEDGQLSVCKITFGAEPKDYEIYDFLLKNDHRLRFSPTVTANTEASKANPKRMQRSIAKQLTQKGVGTKAQQAMQLEHEARKRAAKVQLRKKNEAEKQLRFDLKQQKKKEKHRGR